MQQYLIHLNGGYNPFEQLGRGALGYRPNRRMIGRSSNQVTITNKDDSQLVSKDEDNENNEVIEDDENNKVDDDIQQGGGGGGEDIQLNNIQLNDINNQFAEDYIEELENQKNRNTNRMIDTTQLLKTIKTIKDINKELSGFNERLYKIRNVNTTPDVIEKYKNDPIGKKKYVDNIRNESSKQIIRYTEKIGLDGLNLTNIGVPENIKQQYISIITDMNNAFTIIDIATKTRKKQIDVSSLSNPAALKGIKKNVETKLNSTNSEDQSYINKVKIKAYKNAIEEIIKLKEDKNRKIHKPFDDTITTYLNELNELSNDIIYTIENNKLKESAVEKVTTDRPDFPGNYLQTEAKKDVEAYKKANPVNVILKSKDKYSEDIKDIINNVNNVNLDEYAGTEINESSEYIKPYLKLRENFPNKILSKDYMEKIIINGEKKYKDSTSIDTDYNSAGKSAEFSICGINNLFAKRFYDVEYPNMQITDFIVNNINGDKSGQNFCFDNIDITNKKINEMKYFEKINYIERCNLNRELKLIYINELKEEIKNLIKKIYTPEYKSEIKDNKIKLQDTYNKLDNKANFERAFYSNRKYIGIGITMNKLANIKSPSKHIYNETNTVDMINHVKSSQGRDFVPSFNNDRRVTKVIYDIKTKPEKQKKFNDTFNDIIKGEETPYSFYVTCVFDKVVGVYDYTNDVYIYKNYILDTYKCAFDQLDGKKYNAVLIPIEKFILQRLTDSDVIPSSTPSYTLSTSTQKKKEDKPKKKSKPKNNEFEV